VFSDPRQAWSLGVPESAWAHGSLCQEHRKARHQRVHDHQAPLLHAASCCMQRSMLRMSSMLQELTTETERPRLRVKRVTDVSTGAVECMIQQSRKTLTTALLIDLSVNFCLSARRAQVHTTATQKLIERQQDLCQILRFRHRRINAAS
jgi:hypothetical protein